MAEVPGQQDPSSASKPKEIPSFSGVVKESQEARAHELATLVGSETPPKNDDASKPAAPPAKTETLDINAEWEKLPENLRKGIADGFYSSYNQALQQEYGDLLPLVDECRKNPNLRATFAAAAKDPELLEYLGDPKAREEIKRLTQKELREFIFGEVEGGNASQVFERYRAQIPVSKNEPARDPNAERLKSLEDRMQFDVDDRARTAYVENRKREVAALQTEFGDLKDDPKLLNHVVAWAEQRFEQQAMRAGIVADDQKNPGWPAQALRAGVKPPTYREGYEFYAEVTGRKPASAAPAGSAVTGSSDPKKPQAPRTSTEGKNREAGLQFLKKKGGFNSLVAAASRRGGA